MTKEFEVKWYESDERAGEPFTKRFPTFEEAEAFGHEMFDLGYAVVPHIEEIRI